MSTEKNAAGRIQLRYLWHFLRVRTASLTPRQYARLGDGTDELTTRAYSGSTTEGTAKIERLKD